MHRTRSEQSQSRHNTFAFKLTDHYATHCASGSKSRRPQNKLMKSINVQQMCNLCLLITDFRHSKLRKTQQNSQGYHKKSNASQRNRCPPSKKLTWKTFRIPIQQSRVIASSFFETRCWTTKTGVPPSRKQQTTASLWCPSDLVVLQRATMGIEEALSYVLRQFWGGQVFSKTKCETH